MSMFITEIYMKFKGSECKKVFESISITVKMCSINAGSFLKFKTWLKKEREITNFCIIGKFISKDYTLFTDLSN